ncbi:MAG: hypothetical protein HZB15_06920 [Actinobacteria bacterium]|nr:hypothetical protein [Actinomycetota bacterium]
MSTAGKLAAFAALVAVVFGGAAAVGAAVGPIDVGAGTTAHGGHDTGSVSVVDPPRGLAIAADGYRLVLDTTTVASGGSSSFGFEIVDDDGAPVTVFDDLHTRPLHLIVLSRNMVDYLHVHPTMDDQGHWTVELPSLSPGSYRVFADFQPTGSANLTLGADVAVPGDPPAVTMPAPSDVATTDGYTVTMDGTPTAGDSELSFTVEVDGKVVQTDPYLGAAGHLVAIRNGDLAYLHVHPHDGGTTSAVTFTTEFPSAGTYRLFFDYSHDGTVRTASFTVDVATASGADAMTTHQEEH